MHLLPLQGRIYVINSVQSSQSPAMGYRGPRSRGRNRVCLTELVSQDDENKAVLRNTLYMNHASDNENCQNVTFL
jgi:hypothetical protein